MTDPRHERAPRPEDVDVLRSRAAALARVPRLQRRSEVNSFVVFQLSGESYAIDARHVLQVAVLREFTPLPGASAPLFGVTHWRGDVLTILDLRQELGVRQRGVTDLSRVIVVDAGGTPFGVLADAARDFIDIDEAEVRTLPADEASRRLLVRGITDDAVMIIDPEQLVRAFGGGSIKSVTSGGSK